MLEKKLESALEKKLESALEKKLESVLEKELEWYSDYCILLSLETIQSWKPKLESCLSSERLVKDYSSKECGTDLKWEKPAHTL